MQRVWGWETGLEGGAGWLGLRLRLRLGCCRGLTDGGGGEEEEEAEAEAARE